MSRETIVVDKEKYLAMVELLKKLRQVLGKSTKGNTR